MSLRHFTDLSAVSEAELRAMLDDAARRKARLKAGERSRPLDGKVLAMIFDKPSTRTRVSFDVGMRHSAARPSCHRHRDAARPLEPTRHRKVQSRYVDAIMIAPPRTTVGRADGKCFRAVINGLTDDTHPCQIMPTSSPREHRGPVAAGLRWTGDGNNVLHSLLEASAPSASTSTRRARRQRPARNFVDCRRPMAQRFLHPLGRGGRGGRRLRGHRLRVSMGRNHRARGHNVFSLSGQCGAEAKARPDALFMHCLPPSREEVTDEVIDGRSRWSSTGREPAAAQRRCCQVLAPEPA